jgi:hypothetical protein
MVVAAADFYEDSEFLFPCSAATTYPDDRPDEILAFALPGLSVNPSNEIVLSRAVRLLFFRSFGRYRAHGPRTQHTYEHVYIIPVTLRDGAAASALGCSCATFAHATGDICHAGSASGYSFPGLNAEAFCSTFYQSRLPSGEVRVPPPCLHMRIVLRVLRELPELTQLLPVLPSMSLVPVLPRLRHIAWRGAPLPVVRLPFGRGPERTTRVYSVTDGPLRAVVKIIGQKVVSCARLAGLDQCPTARRCSHKALALGEDPDLPEPQKAGLRTTAREQAHLLALETGMVASMV